ncbi:MAG TPA: tetratricopeptide repeat protein [Kofleriaceae bacterium]|nr:tetratricopeptide repeat protein [Kofleriaceae bacterium]
MGAFVALAACGGTTKTGTTPEGSGGGTDKKPNGTDLTIDLDVVPLKGLVFTPEAMGRPPMLLVEEKKKQTLDKDRADYAKAPDLETKKLAVNVLATALYQESKKQKDDAKEKALRDEAKKDLNEIRAAAASAGGANEVSLRMLVVFDMIDQDYAAAADVYQELLKRFPTSDKALDDKAWLALCYLRLGKNADALATLSGLQPDPAHPEAAYVMAWAKWRGGDNAGAVAAITASAQGWKDGSNKPALVRDLLILLGRGGAPADGALKTVQAFYQGKAPVSVLYNLHNAYAYAGRWADAIEVLENIIKTVPEQIAKNDLPKFRSQQAQYSVRLLAADQVASYEKQAMEAYAACGDKCTAQELDDGYKALRGLAITFHAIYATSMDERFYGPAKELYELYDALPGRADAEEMKKHESDLEAAKKAAKPGTGTHDKSIIGPLLAQQHAQEIQACYEAALAADASVSGMLGLTIDFDATGKVAGATSNPPPGKEGLARVGACASEAAKGWMLPARTIPGKTIVNAKFELAPAAK